MALAYAQQYFDERPRSYNPEQITKIYNLLDDIADSLVNDPKLWQEDIDKLDSYPLNGHKLSDYVLLVPGNDESEAKFATESAFPARGIDYAEYQRIACEGFCAKVIQAPGNRFHKTRIHLKSLYRSGGTHVDVIRLEFDQLVREQGKRN